MLAQAEGTYGIGDNGYNVLVGSTPRKPLLFEHYNDHPRIYNKTLNSTAAGRYQLLARYYDHYKKILVLSDFSPESQDAIALRQIAECHALDDIDEGSLPEAVRKCARIWASLPGNTYGQHQQAPEFLQQAFIDAGGVIS